MEGSTHQHKHEGVVRTDMNCTNCSKDFIAELDYDLNGNYTIHCPHCNHRHLRTIKNGVMTETRWGSDDGSPVECRRVWKHATAIAKTSTASEFIRHRWLNREPG